ncbi:hypothetical protein FA95DRAFT_1552520 [Auriscalpium vulgare]|uniref:Uncharacterized protein n=1 Tax=Auriscalpium vulgare TaxID=40419 RepID=A0ACB8SC40_9AGAM|nr:hypothetical protein FA95DRAFT_1552520 [Auriscalpium vulgare]
MAGGFDDLGVLKENPEEMSEVALRRQLLEKDRENDRLQAQIQGLQTQLAQRPPIERIQAVEKEYHNLELLLQGTLRENERAMVELERGKQREKLLERELSKLAGDNWQTNLEIAPAATSFVPRSATAFNFTSPQLGFVASPTPDASAPAPPSQASVEATLAHVEQVRLLILGMEQRLQSREESLVKTIEKAEGEGARFDQMRKNVLEAKS